MRKAIISGTVFALLLAITIFLILFQVFDFLSWRNILIEGTPLAIFVVLASVFLGLLFGLILYQQPKKQQRLINEKLKNVLAGKTDMKIHYNGNDKEIKQTIFLINELEQQLNQVTNRMQEVMSERLENQEELIEKRLTEERNRLARELHDSVSQELFAASMLVSAVNEAEFDNGDDISEPLNQIEAMIQQAQIEMRALLLHLRPIALRNHTLKEGIDQILAELVEKVPINIKWRTENVSLNRAVEDHLFRILQESVSNALRHAKAEQIDVLFTKRDQMAILSVIDDGVGFDPEVALSSSYGLANMRERTTEIGGQFKLISMPEQGTKITVLVPLNREG